MTSVIVTFGVERFGVVEKPLDKYSPYTKNRREAKISLLWQEIRSLKWQFKKAAEKEKGSVAELHTILRKKLITLQRSEALWDSEGEEAGLLHIGPLWIRQKATWTEAQWPTVMSQAGD